jgi:hypothetical protein
MLDLAMYHMAEEQVRQRAEGASSVLRRVHNLIECLDDDSPAVIQICDGLTRKILGFFEAYPNNDCFTELLRLIAAINQQITATREIQIEVLPGILVLLSDDELGLLNASEEVARLIYPLFTLPDAPLLGMPGLVEGVCGIGVRLLDYAYNNDESGEDGVPYGHLLGSCLIQVFGAPMLAPILPFAVREIENEMDLQPEAILGNPINFVGLCYTIAAGFLVDVQQTLAAIGGPGIEFVMEVISEQMLTTFREMKIGFIILLTMVRERRAEAFAKASELFPTLIELKERDKGDDDEGDGKGGEEEDDKEEAGDEDEEEDEETDEITRIVAPFQMPFDKFDVIALYRTVGDESGLFQILDAELQAKIGDLLNQETAAGDAE